MIPLALAAWSGGVLWLLISWGGPKPADPGALRIDPLGRVLLCGLGFYLMGWVRTLIAPNSLGSWALLGLGFGAIGALLGWIVHPRRSPGLGGRLGFGVAAWALLGPWVILLQGWIRSGGAGAEELELQPTLQAWMNAGAEVRVSMAVVLVFGVPWVEELLFRGLLQSGLRDLFSPLLPPRRAAGAAVFLSSLAFAAVHHGSVFFAVLITSLGIGALAERTRGIAAGFAFHACNNAAALLLTWRG